MKKNRFLQLVTGIIIGALIFGAAPTMAADMESSGQTYIISDYYNEDGTFSELGAALVVDSEMVLAVSNGDIIVAGDRWYQVEAPSITFYAYTQPSLTQAIEWWVDYLISWETGGYLIEIEDPDIYLIGLEATAYVVKLDGNQNDLYITVTKFYTDGSTAYISAVFKINNNAAGTYNIGGHSVYVDTKGNDQIRACSIVE